MNLRSFTTPYFHSTLGSELFFPLPYGRGSAFTPLPLPSRIARADLLLFHLIIVVSISIANVSRETFSLKTRFFNLIKLQKFHLIFRNIIQINN